MPRTAVATNRRGMDNGNLPALGGHDLQGRKMRLQLAPLVTTDMPVDGRPIRQLRITRINPDALQMFMIFQHVAADHHQTAFLLSRQQRHALCPFYIYRTRMLH
ncbi:hypothetical protein D3C78_1678390 [compost metagenome]